MRKNKYREALIKDISNAVKAGKEAELKELQAERALAVAGSSEMRALDARYKELMPLSTAVIREAREANYKKVRKLGGFSRG